jgi:hypothetical protein
VLYSFKLCFFQQFCLCLGGGTTARLAPLTLSLSTFRFRSLHGAATLAEDISLHHAQQLREFVSIITSLLLRPMDMMDPPPLSTRRPPPLCPPLPATVLHSQQQHQHQNEQQRSSRFSTALAPLASHGVQLPGPLPRVSLLTLEFENSSFETEFHVWKAECTRNQDLWSLFACFTVILASLQAATPLAQLLQVVAIFAAAAGTTTLATRMQASSNTTNLPVFYRENRDKIMVAFSLCIAAGLSIVGGGSVVYNQIFALVAVLLPVRLRWQVAQLFLVLAWRIVSATSMLSSPFILARLFLGVVIAPFTLAYVVECVARRGFLSRRALVAAANAPAYEDDDEYEFEDDEEDEDFWLHEDEEDF